MFEQLKQPWPWYIAGPLIGLIIPALLISGNKAFGISSSLKHICAACVPANINFFKYDWKKESWNLFFISGILIGAWIATYFLSFPDPVAISTQTKEMLHQQGVKDFSGLMPADIFSLKQLFTLKSLVFFILGGFMVGFGTRYADGCTSGHSIMGIANLQWPSLVATCCFMLGGILMSWFILPYLLQL
ncbi:YeeE/YedE family protein [Rubrolithibacter danxiaensis]|uniref:YeeE/YedE family protein n=1 Tax=Rubrolithibacter danxiaensis TaxID=3390805 RepID=UPI003BF7B359